MNAAAAHKLKCISVNLLFDKETQQIAIKPCNPSALGARKVNTRSYNYTISSKAFLKYYKIPFTETYSYKATWNAKYKMLIFSIK